MRFLGLAVPGAQDLGPDEDLVAIWRAKGLDNQRFQNYKSIFTILDVPIVKRAWINDIQKGITVTSPHAPKAWLEWVNSRKYTPLHAPHSIETRTKNHQLPSKAEDLNLISFIYDRFKDNPFSFEKCAVEIAKLMLPDIGHCEITRPWRDGGRDAVGTYTIGKGESAIDVDFALEAKCYKPGSGVGVKELSRLISRLRHRQFGILVTTSFLSDQAYKELKEDQHPVVIISAADIANLLRTRLGNDFAINLWLNSLS